MRPKNNFDRPIKLKRYENLLKRPRKVVLENGLVMVTNRPKKRKLVEIK